MRNGFLGRDNTGRPSGKACLSGSVLSGCYRTQDFRNIVYFVIEQIKLARQTLDLRLCATIDFEIQFGAQSVFIVLAILAHHDDRRLKRGQYAEKQVEQDERIRIPCSAA
jgi:hypothetical protein